MNQSLGYITTGSRTGTCGHAILLLTPISLTTWRTSVNLQEQARARAAQLAGAARAEASKTCPFRPNANDEMQRIENIIAQDDSWLSD